jgi:tetratricopeptide (TPR) repeat protein
LLVAAAFATYRRNQLWGSEAALWQDTVAKSPNKLRGYSHLVHGLVNEHHCREALQRLDELSRRRSIDPQLLAHWAVAYECVHEPENALAKLQQAALLSPNAATYMEIARNQLALNRTQDALGSLNRALELDATLEPAYIARGELRELQGDRSGAAMDYSRVLQLNSSNEQARQLLRLVSNY